jgi:asparagine synthase (glutamine-hydrolysing)
MTREHVTVALSGEGADELFAGYNTYAADNYARMARRLPAGLRRTALAALRFWPVSDDKISLEYKLKRFLRGSLLSEEDAHVFWNGTFSPADKDALLQPHARRPLPALPFDRNLGPLNRFLHFDQLYYLQDDILNKCDRMSMAHSLEVRPAFLDHRIVEFASTLPENLKRRGSKLKFVLRELMRDKLPASVLTRKKEGFDIPAHEWLRGALRPLLLETLSRSAVESTGVFRWEGVNATVRNHLERHANLGYHLWGLLILLLWMKRWNIQGAAPREESRRARTASAMTLSSS